MRGPPGIPVLRELGKNGCKSASPIAFYRALAHPTQCMRYASRRRPGEKYSGPLNSLSAKCLSPNSRCCPADADRAVGANRYPIG